MFQIKNQFIKKYYLNILFIYYNILDNKISKKKLFIKILFKRYFFARDRFLKKVTIIILKR